jgi:predicted NUDIX family NTP pyrophosphohydrolase
MARTPNPIEPQGQHRPGPVSGRRSAGLLVYRLRGGVPDFLLAHPGGPYWRGRNTGAWSIPKGLIEPGEDALAAACREFQEEVGLPVDGEVRPLTPRRQPGGKLVLAWMTEADLDLSTAKSREFEMEWPPRSGRLARFPEVDRVAYFGPEESLTRILPGQRPILVEAAEWIANPLA